MKTYEEMAQSVIRRAKSHKTIRNRRILGATAAACVLGACLSMMLVKAPTDSKEPTLQTPVVTTPTVNEKPIIQTQLPTEPTADSVQAKVTLLYNDGLDTISMGKNMTIPCRSLLRVQDINGLTAAEADAVAKAEAQYAEDLIASYPEAKGWDWSQYCGEKCVMTSINAGHFILGIEEPEQVESVHATVEGDIQLMYLPTIGELKHESGCDLEYGLTHEEVQQYYYAPCGGLEISWLVAGELAYAFDENPIPLSSIRDTITFTVTFVDDTVETHAVDMIFNDNGEIYAIYQGLTAAV